MGKIEKVYEVTEMGYPTYDFTANQYQNKIEKIQKNYPDYADNSLAVFALGLNGEAGEVAELVKRYYREGNLPSDEVIAKELGDVIAYICLIANHLGLSLETIMLMNIEKLEKRIENGTTLGKGSDR